MTTSINEEQPFNSTGSINSSANLPSMSKDKYMTTYENFLQWKKCCGPGVEYILLDKTADIQTTPRIVFAEDIAKMRQTINLAVEAGYRHIDTASLYRNEDQIGLGIKDVIGRGLVKREDLFVTTKLWNDKHARNQVVPSLRESLARLGLNYVDLYLIHFPDAENADGSPANIDYLETWKGMEEAKKLGLAKSIGISNFDINQIDRLMANSEIKPAVNEIEINPTLTQEALVEHCHKLGIVVMAYSPFGFLVNRGNPNAPPPRSDDPTLTEIAKKYGKTTSQVVLRYLLDRGTIPIPKSTNKARLQQNIDVFDFQLTPQEVATINKFNQNKGVFS